MDVLCSSTLGECMGESKSCNPRQLDVSGRGGGRGGGLQLALGGVGMLVVSFRDANYGICYSSGCSAWNASIL